MTKRTVPSARSGASEHAFEDYEPAAGDEVDLAEYELRRAVIARARSERQVLDAVLTARRAGVSWARIGRELGASAQAAQHRLGEIQAAT